MITTISYIAGGGGNHLKNLMCLDESFANSTDLDLSIYYDRLQHPPGTVHSRPGRNVGSDIIERMINGPAQNWLLHGHWGELMPYRKSINDSNNRWLLLTIDSQDDRELISTRNQRLGQQSHPYWLDEEQPYLYQTDMYCLYFGARPENIFHLSLVEFWNPDLQVNAVIPRINQFFNINIDPDKAQELHQKWWKMNFDLFLDQKVRLFYSS